MGFPDVRSPACVCERPPSDTPSDRDLKHALTGAELASGKSLVVMCSSEVPRLDAVLEGLWVMGGELSSPRRLMRWLAPMPRPNDYGG
jgi:hypothetical protein